MIYLLPIILLSGCVLTPADRQAYIRAQVQQSQQPTIEIECPERGCNFRRFAYRDKRSPVQMPRETTGMDLASKAIDGLVKLGGIAAPAWAAVELGRAIRDSKSGDTITTSKVKTSILGVTSNDDSLGLRTKVVTENGIVYLMGLLSRQEADAVTNAARQVGGVQRVVKLFEYTD